MASPTLDDLLVEFDRSLAYTDDLYRDLSQAEVHWRSGEDASAIGWHLGHQAAVSHYMVRNLTAAEPPLDAELDALMDSATPESERGALPDVSRITEYRNAVAERVRFRMSNINDGHVGAPAQLRVIATGLLTAVINHEYQHSKWIAEVRADVHNRDLPPTPMSQFLTELDGYCMLA